MNEAQASNPVTVSLRRFRAFGISVALVGILVALTVFLIDGLKIDTRDASKLSDSKKSKLLNRYNTYSGIVGSIVSLPFQPFVDVDNCDEGPVIRRCRYFLADCTGNERIERPIRLAQCGIHHLCQRSSQCKRSICFASTVTQVTDTTTLAGISNTDMILRAAIQPLASNYTTACLVEDGLLYNRPDASVRFGFPLNSWLEDMLPESIASDEWFSFTMGNSFASGEIDTSVLPGGNLNKTAEFVSYALYSVWTAFTTLWSDGIGVNITAVYTAIDTSDAASLLTSVQAVMTEYDNSESGWNYISVPESSVKLATLILSPQVKFESVTFDLPVKNSTMSEWTSNETDWKGEMSYATNCNDHACVMGTPIVSGLPQDHVRMIRMCMLDADGSQEDLVAISHSATNGYDNSCKFVSKSFVLILSLARHVRWNNCAEGAECESLFFALGNASQHVVVGKANLPVPMPVIYPVYFDAWQPLVVTNAQLNTDDLQGNIIYPPMYPSTEGSYDWNSLNTTMCTFTGSDFINDMVQQHMYSKGPVQSAYTAGLFWLFQNAAVKDVASVDRKLSSGVKLNFAGNRQWLSSHVSIPPTSAWVTFAGCALLLILGMLVTCARQSKLPSDLSTQNVAEILLKSPEYPELLVKPTVALNKGDINSGSPYVESLDKFVISELTLSH